MIAMLAAEAEQTRTKLPQQAAAILRPSALTPHERGGGARTTPLVTPAVGSTRLLNGITEFDPGGAISPHFHDCEESVMVIEGNAIAVIEGVAHRLATGDTTWLPAGIAHYFSNASSTDRLRIFWTYASTDATRTLVATGETRRVNAEARNGG